MYKFAQQVNILVLPAENIMDMNYVLIWQLSTEIFEEWLENNAFNLQKENGLQPESIFNCSFYRFANNLLCFSVQPLRNSVLECKSKKQILILLVSMEIELFYVRLKALGTLDQKIWMLYIWQKTELVVVTRLLPVSFTPPI